MKITQVYILLHKLIPSGKKMENCIPYDFCKLSAIFHQIFHVFFIKTNYAKVASFGYF
jgi:hypothetical protein